MNVQAVLPYLQTLLAFANICVLAYAFLKFINKPHDTLEDKVNDHEVRIKTLEARREQEDERDKEQDDTNEVLIRSVFALLEFEVHYCETEQKPITKNLEKAKDDLHDYLARK